MAVTLPADVLCRYRRFTLYNSPYAAHDHGRAVDLYPGDATHPDPVEGDPVAAPSPVAGEVIDTRTVAGPSRPYAADEDHLVVVDTAVGGGPTLAAEESPVARLMHVDPAVEPGDRVAVGDSLGTLVRAGFFAPWVADHLHLGFRPRDADPYRASGSLPLALDPDLELELVPVAWDGTGTVVAAGDTYAVLDRPRHPDPGGAFAGLAATVDGRVAGVLDGGLPHYDGGGLLAPNDGQTADKPVELLGEPVGTASGRDVTWGDVTVLANDDPVRGLALAPARDRLGVKLVGEAVDLPVGVEVTVRVTTLPNDHVV